MVFPESEYDRFIALSKKQKFVCFGAGKALDRAVGFLRRHGLIGNLAAMIDNDSVKQGQTKIIDGIGYDIKNSDELERLRRKSAFFILVTSKFYQEIERQVRANPALRDIEVLDMKAVMEERAYRLACYADVFRDAGIGVNGEKLTISILMHNRASLTVRLIESISALFTGYQGKVIIGNNGSEREEVSLVKEKLKQTALDYKVFDFGQHYPIPQGKNMLNRKVDTEWILQLDNDMYFTDNPISKMNEDISSLGCFIWGLPYYDTRYDRVANYGSNLKFYREGGKVRRLECLYDLPFEQEEREWQPMLCTYAAGGASLFRKDIFTGNGEYDENLYVLEDMELMYRLNMAGYKIGNIGMKCLVHDHKAMDDELGKQYEKTRFDEVRIQNSKMYLEGKYGFRV